MFQTRGRGQAPLPADVEVQVDGLDRNRVGVQLAPGFTLHHLLKDYHVSVSVVIEEDPVN